MLRLAKEDNLKQRASGHWVELLTSAGIPREHLDGRGHPCPKCAGTDRFAAFKDVQQTGGVHCRKCFDNGGDGFATVSWLLGLNFGQAKTWVQTHLERHAKIERLQESLPKGQAWPTCREAVAALGRFMTKRHGASQTGLWTYKRGCDPVAVAVRYDWAGGKTYRPVSKHADSWRWSDPTGLWPLYSLTTADDLSTVFIVEGEKCCDAVRSFGLVAVASAHGAGSTGKDRLDAISHRSACRLASG